MNGMEDEYRQLFQNDVVNEPYYDEMWRKINMEKKHVRFQIFKGAKGLLALGIVLTVTVGSASAGYISKFGKTEIKVVSEQELPMAPPELKIKAGEEFPDPSLFGTISKQESEKVISTKIFEPTYVPNGFKLAFEGGQDYEIGRMENGEFQKREFIPIHKFLYNIMYTLSGSVPKREQMNEAVLIRYRYYNTDIKSSVNFRSENTVAFTLEGLDAFDQGGNLTVFKPTKNNGLVEMNLIGPISLDEKKKIMKSIIDQEK